jgi:hypothetical protein
MNKQNYKVKWPKLRQRNYFCKIIGNKAIPFTVYRDKDVRDRKDIKLFPGDTFIFFSISEGEGIVKFTGKYEKYYTRVSMNEIYPYISRSTVRF